MTTRRLFLRGLIAGALIGVPWSAGGQQPPGVARVGVLYYNGRSNSVATAGLPLLRKRLQELGYVEGKNLLIEDRYADGNAQRLDELARELVAARVDVIVASAIAAASAARRATATIPIVMVHASNPIGAGLIASLTRPGANVTGTAYLPLGGKQVELIRAEDFPKAFAAIRDAHPDALMVLVEPLIGAHGKQIVDFAALAHLPTVFDFGSMVRMGGLISYGPVFLDHYTLAADFVDRILKGAKPADLPVQQPTSSNSSST